MLRVPEANTSLPLGLVFALTVLHSSTIGYWAAPQLWIVCVSQDILAQMVEVRAQCVHIRMVPERGSRN